MSSLKISVQTKENASSNLCDLARINGKFKSLRELKILDLVGMGEGRTVLEAWRTPQS